MLVALEEITDANREAVLGLRAGPDQERFVGSVRGALADAADLPHANPWYRAAYVGTEPVGFVMVSWNVPPQPPEIIGPAGYYQRLGFVPIGEIDVNGEVIVRLALS